jgi:hypothetical protein
MKHVDLRQKVKTELMLVLAYIKQERKFGFEFEFPKELKAAHKPIDDLTIGEMRQLIDEGRRLLQLVDAEEPKCQSVN